MTSRFLSSIRGLVIDSVENAIGSPTSTQYTLQLVPKRNSDPFRVVEQHSGDEGR